VLLVQHPDLVVDLSDVLKLICVNPFGWGCSKSILSVTTVGVVSIPIAFISKQVDFVELDVFSFFAFFFVTVSLVFVLLDSTILTKRLSFGRGTSISLLLVQIMIDPFRNSSLMVRAFKLIFLVVLLTAIGDRLMVVGCEATILVSLEPDLLVLVLGWILQTTLLLCLLCLSICKVLIVDQMA